MEKGKFLRCGLVPQRFFFMYMEAAALSVYVSLAG